MRQRQVLRAGSGTSPAGRKSDGAVGRAAGLARVAAGTAVAAPPRVLTPPAVRLCAVVAVGAVSQQRR